MIPQGRWAARALMERCPPQSFVIYVLLGCFVLLDGNSVLSESHAPSVMVFTSLVNPPFMERKGTLTGFIPDLVAKIAQRLRTPYHLKEVAWGAYGVKQESGVWNGMIGEVMRGEADVAAGALSVVPWRQELVDFTIPFMEAGIAVIVKRPPNKNHPLPFTHPRELANQTDIKYGLIRGTLTDRFFLTTNDTYYRQMWRIMYRSLAYNGTVFERTASAGVKRVRESNGKYVFMIESSFAEFLANQRPCDLMMLDELLNPTPYAFAVQKGSRLRNRLNRAIRTLLDNGTIDRLRQKWWKGKCNRQKRKKKKSNHNMRVGQTSTPKREDEEGPNSEESPVNTDSSDQPQKTDQKKPSVQRSRTRSVWRNSAARTSVGLSFTSFIVLGLMTGFYTC